MAPTQKRDFALTNRFQLSPTIVPYVFLVLATLAVVLRFRARRLRKVGLGLDDWTCLAALLLAWPYQATNTIGIVKGGVGVPLPIVATTDPHAIVILIKAITSSNLMWSFTVTLLQVSILTFYIRVFGVVRWFRTAAVGLMVIVSCFEVAGFISQLLACIPLKKFWSPMTPGHCFNQHAFCAAFGLLHVIFDLAVICLPIPVIWSLQMSRGNKGVLTVVLTVGTLATLTSLLKLTCLIHFDFLNLADATGSIWYSILLQAIEIPVGIICVCVPTLPPVWAEFKESKAGSAARRFLTTMSFLSTRTSTKDSRTSNKGDDQNSTPSSRDFHKLDDSRSYATDVETGRSGGSVAYGDQIPLNEMGKAESNEGRMRNNIKVSTTWNVEGREG